MKIVYLHGLNSSPNSFKRQAIEKMGHEVYAPFLMPDNWEQSVLVAREYIEMVKPDVVVGSSRGGAVAMAAGGKQRLVLIAPAWSKYCPWCTTSSTTKIIHSKSDDVIPYADSELLAKTFGAALIESGNDHRMNDSSTLNLLSRIIKEP